MKALVFPSTECRPIYIDDSSMLTSDIGEVKLPMTVIPHECGQAILRVEYQLLISPEDAIGELESLLIIFQVVIKKALSSRPRYITAIISVGGDHSLEERAPHIRPLIRVIKDRLTSLSKDVKFTGMSLQQAMASLLKVKPSWATAIKTAVSLRLLPNP